MKEFEFDPVDFKVFFEKTVEGVESTEIRKEPGGQFIQFIFGSYKGGFEIKDYQFESMECKALADAQWNQQEATKEFISNYVYGIISEQIKKEIKHSRVFK